MAGQAQRLLQLHLLVHGRRAFPAIAQMSRELLLGCSVQLIIHILSNFVAPRATHDFTPAVSKMYSRTCFLARASRDITVPIGIFSASATSWYFISSISANNSTSRKASES